MNRSPYDLTSGCRGYKSLALSYKKSLYRSSASHLRASYANTDSLSPEAIRARKLAGELERKVLEIERQMRTR